MFVRIILGILLLALGQVGYARDYAVELIVFERSDALNETEEVWDFSSEHITGKRQKMRALSAKSIAYDTRPALNNLAAIRRNLLASGYRILHTANWIQPAATYRFAPLISFGTADSSLPYGFIKVYKTSLIFADINIQYSPTDFTNTATITPAPARVGIDTNEPVNATETFSTNINPTAIDLEPQQPHFFMSEKRRLKFKEIHYLDHPLFGVIIGVWSSKSPES